MNVWLVAALAALAVAAALPAAGPRPASVTVQEDGARPSAPPGPAAPRWRAGAAVAAGLAAAVIVGGRVGVVVALPGAALCWHLVGTMEGAAARKRRERLLRGLPHVVDLMAACLRSGASPDAAVARVARAVDPPMCEELAVLAARMRLGTDPTRVWRELGAHPQLGPLGRCVARATESGASVADAMQRLAEDQRRAARALVENRARAVGVKAAVPLGLCLLPAFILVGIVPLVAGALTGFLVR